MKPDLFSAESTTAKVARDLSDAIGANVFEIKPEKPYTPVDLNWKNPFARCNREKIGKKDVPSFGKVEDFATYDTIVLVFPFSTELRRML